MSFIGTDDYFSAVARGDITGHTAVNKYGRNPDCDQAASSVAVQHGRDVWDGGIAGATMWLPPTTARTHAIVSSAAGDNLAGTGAHTLRIFGLDATYVLQQEDISMHATDGTIAVNTANTYTMIHRIYVLTAGSVGYNSGAITATAATDGTVTAKITAANAQTAMAIYQIPLATTGYLHNFYGSIHKAGGAAKLADIALMVKEFGGVWRLHDAFDVASDGSNYVAHEHKIPHVAAAKSYIKVVANPSADAQDVSAGFDMVLVAD